MLSKFKSSEPTPKKLRLTVHHPPPGSSIKIFMENESGDLSEIKECSPLNSQDENTKITRFPWKKTVVNLLLPPEEEIFVPPTKSTMSDFIFKSVKDYLANANGWDGEDRFMKTSTAMKILLHSGTILKVTKEGRKMTERSKKRRDNKPNIKSSKVEETEIVDVKFVNGNITWGTGGNGMCDFGNCWKTVQSGGKCAEHNNCHITHFLIKDEHNPTPMYFLLSTYPHSPKFTHTLAGCLQTAKNCNGWKAFSNYEKAEIIRKRADAAGDLDEDDKRRQEVELYPKWKLVTSRPWITEGLESSNVFKQSVNIVLAILATINVNNAGQFNIIGDQFYIDKVDWTVVKTILESVGFQIGLGEPSEYGILVESPMLKKSDLRWRDGDQWVYWKFGTIGRIYTGKVKQYNDGKGPMPNSYIHPHHGPNEKGIPIFQCEAGDAESIKKETSKMEGVGQLGVIICQMLGGTIDEHPIKIDFTKYEHFSDWEEHHLVHMKTLVGFWASRELEFTPPETLDISDIKWDSLKKYLRDPDM